MQEKRVQFDLVMWFKQTYPHLQNYLFEVNNDTYNVKHAMARRGLGMLAGVSDLVLIHPENKTVMGIEMKAPNKRHKVSHLKQQIEWGREVCKAYVMSYDLELIKMAIISFLDDEIHSFIVPKIDYTKKTFCFK